MVGPEVLTRKVLALREALEHLGSAAPVTPGRLRADATLRAAVERWMQIAVEACIGAAFHLVAARGAPPPDSARSAFRALAGRGLLDGELAERLGSAAGLRDVLVHDYADVDVDLDVDLDRPASAIGADLHDLRRFGEVLSDVLRREGP